jgi:hypothetical protein
MKGPNKPGAPGQEQINYMGYLAVVAFFQWVVDNFNALLNRYMPAGIIGIDGQDPVGAVLVGQGQEEEDLPPLQGAELPPEMQEEEGSDHEVDGGGVDMHAHIGGVYGIPNPLDTSGVTIVGGEEEEEVEEDVDGIMGGVVAPDVLTPKGKKASHNEGQELNGDTSEDEEEVVEEEEDGTMGGHSGGSSSGVQRLANTSPALSEVDQEEGSDHEEEGTELDDDQVGGQLVGADELGSDNEGGELDDESGTDTPPIGRARGMTFGDEQGLSDLGLAGQGTPSGHSGDGEDA